MTNYITELRSKKKLFLAPERIEEYLRHIHEQGGSNMCHALMRYVIIVLAKYLQMVVAYDIFNNNVDRVTKHFEDFNSQYSELMEVFSKVTGGKFEPGREIETLLEESSSEKQEAATREATASFKNVKFSADSKSSPHTAGVSISMISIIAT